jgi:hypothetical protein
MSDTGQAAGPTEETLSGNIMLFTVKVIIVVIAVSLCTVFVADRIIDRAQDSIALAISNVRQQVAETPIGGPEMWAKVERILDRAADPSSDLPPEKKLNLINDVRVVVSRWRPFIDAAEDEMKKPASAN